MRKIYYIIIAAGMLFLFSCGHESYVDPSSQNGKPSDHKITTNIYTWVKSIHTELGVPYDSDTTNDYIIIRSQYVLSYNRYKGTPNWVSWNLNADWYGSASRWSGNFITDTSLPSGYYRVTHSDYSNSGYDRGHMVRSEERTKTVADNKATFILTNIIPQTADLNRGVWLNLEYYCEDLCKNKNKELYIISGPVNHSTSTLNNAGKVVIPDSCFKIIVVMNRGQKLSDISTSAKVYAVIMPNISGIRLDKWTKYQTTVRKVEYSTNYNFLDFIPDSIEKILEERIDKPL